MKYFLYGHNGSGNHGCEAIVRSTCKILKTIDKNTNIELATGNRDEDVKYGLEEFVNLKNEKNETQKLSISYIKAYLSLKLFKNDLLSEELCYKETFNNVSNDTIALSIGGDNYCYPGYQRFMMLHNMLRKRGIKTVLWGCSVEPNKIVEDLEMKKDLCLYDLIVARESITFEALSSIGANAILFPDPAFQLNKILKPLPSKFIEGNTVGINISPMVMNNEKKNGIVLENYKNLIEYIINTTSMNIALIPHVIWEDNNDDRIPCIELYEKYKDTDRICMLDDMNAEELKGYISRCKYFIGARTHSTIAAYSTLVPTLVIGYSVKAKGIAKDIYGTYENYVLPAQMLETKNDLINGFNFIRENEKEMIEMQKEYLSKIDNLELKSKIEEIL